MIEIPDLVYRLLRQMTASTRDAIKGDRDAVEITPGGEIKGKLKVGSKVRVKKGLGMVSGKTGTILRSQLKYSKKEDEMKELNLVESMARTNKFSVYNLGPIWEATVDLSKFNLISGKNATGKSFFVRLLYTIVTATRNKQGEDLEKTLAKKIRWVFQQKDISAIVNRITGGDLYARVTVDNKTFLSFSISRFTRIKINGSWSGKITLRQDNVKKIEFPYRNCLFISSPCILDTELALANYRCYRNNLGVSDIFWDALQAIRTVGIADEIELESVSKKIEKTIGGKFLYKAKQGVVFKEKEKEKEYDVKITASGIKIFGILQLLIERNLLTKDSLLVIEEPECNLHPVYIFKFVEILVELTKQGVYVIAVTHSGELIRYIEYLVKTKKLLSSDICFALFKKGNELAFVRTGNDLSILTEMLEDLRMSKDESTT